MRPWWLPCRRRRRSRWESCWSLVYLRVQPLLWRSGSSPAFGSRSGARHGFGNYWFRCSHRSDSRWDAQVVPGASTSCWHGGAPRPRGGDEGICVRVSVIIPTHNEAQGIGRVLADLPSDLVTEVIVVDSNSTDGTPDLARKMGAQVIQEPRRGYGRACLTGLANTQNPDVVVFLDGDYSDRPSELPIILAPIIEGRADITLGSRFGGKSNPGALPWHQSFGNRLAAGLIRLLYGVKVSDLGPFRASRADVLRALALEEATYGWAVEMIVEGAIAGFRIVEVSVSYYPRIGKSQISGTVKGTIGAAWFILSRILRYYFLRRRAGTPRPA